MSCRVTKFVDLAAGLALAWAVAVMVPAETFWFSPDTPVVADSTVTKPPVISFTRLIKRDVRMRYQVTIRQVEGLTPVCDPHSNAITYSKTAKLPEIINLIWWTGGDARCWPRETGTYLMETCWTVMEPFWGLVPPKTVCRESPPFRITKEG